MSDKKQYEDNNRGHRWQRDSDGMLNIFGYEGGEYHNGPICIDCGYGFCHHCQELPEEDCPKTNRILQSKAFL